MQEGLRFRLQVYITVLAVVVICGTIGLMLAEDLHPFDALYFVIVTIATVGFGDISPHTVPGKVITRVIILTGVGCFVAVAANAVEYFIAEREYTERTRKMDMLVGVFFSEVGTSLLRMFSAVDPAIDEIRDAHPGRTCHLQHLVG
jgi:sorbitol-specific phosphotransferase system component IIBC